MFYFNKKGNMIETFTRDGQLIERETEKQVINGTIRFNVISERVIDLVEDFFERPRNEQIEVISRLASTKPEDGKPWDPWVIGVCNRLKIRLAGMEDNGYPLIETHDEIPTKQIEDLFK